MGKSAPKPPDPRETSAAQTGTNVATAVANNWMTNMDEVTPDGSKTFNQIGQQSFTDPYTGKTYTIPRFQVTQRLSEQQQAIKDQRDTASMNLAKLGADQSARIGGLLGSSLDISNAPSAPTATPDGPSLQKGYIDDFSADRSKVEDAFMSRMQPRLDQDREGLRSRLVNQGINEGSEAYDRAMERHGRQVNDVRSQAIMLGGQEQSRLAGLAQAQAGFGNSARQQEYQNSLSGMDAQSGLRARALQEKFALRNQPINEVSALMSGGQVSMPAFMTGANVRPMQGTDNAALINNNYQQRLGAWQTKQAVLASALGTAGSIFAGL